MSITTYSELQTAAANWSGRSDLTSRIPEFISLAEAKMNRRLRVKNMVTVDPAFPITGEYVGVPANFGGVRTFYLNTNPIVHLDFMADALMATTFGNSGSGQPQKFNIQGSNFRFAPMPDATYSAHLAYYLKVPALGSSGSATTNWLLTDHPDAYVYATLSELAGFAKDWDSAEKWITMSYKILDDIQVASNRDRYSGDAVLVARPA